MRTRFFVCLAALLAISTAAPLKAAGLKPQVRMAIIRGLTAEYATLKVPLPKGKKGLILESSGVVDQQSLQREIANNGTAVAARSLVQITAIEIDDKEIALEINGGGTKKTKWYEHIEVGMGSGTRPINDPNAKQSALAGSSILLKFPKGMESELTVADLKNYLAPVLDFNPTSPIQAMTRPVPPKFKDAIEAKRAERGMDREMVVAAMGQPQRKIRENKDGIEQEDWIYGTPPLKTIFVTFEGDEVVEVKEYTGGIGGSVQMTSEEPIR